MKERDIREAAWRLITQPPQEIRCQCIMPAREMGAQTIMAYSGTDPGLLGLHVRKFCGGPPLPSGETRATCNVSGRALYTESPSASGPSRVRRQRATATGRPAVAWVLAGGLRSFFSPVVHSSLMNNAIRAVGGEPSLFLIATLANDQKRWGAAREDLSVAAAAGGTSSCARRYDSLATFLAAHPEWEALTVHIAVETDAQPASASPNPACHPLSDVEADYARRIFQVPQYTAQMARWAQGFSAVRRHEREHRRGVAFDFVGRLRFDTMVAAPLPADLLLSAHVANVAFAIDAKVHSRLLPLPDFFWIVPRAHAAAAFDVMGRYQRCGRQGAALKARAPAPDVTNASAGCIATGVCRDIPRTARRLPPLCCGGGPTGVLVRMLLRAADQATPLGTRDSSASGGGGGGGGSGSGNTSITSGTASQDAPHKPAPVSSGLTVHLLEHPIFVVGHVQTAHHLCNYRTPSTVMGYFASRHACFATVGACGAAAAAAGDRRR
jgi:hypothetical protein